MRASWCRRWRAASTTRADARKRAAKAKAAPTPTELFHRHRLAQLQRARTLAMLLIPFDAGYAIPLRRAPDVHEACSEAYGAAAKPSSLRCANCWA
jgi:hypothetical protein